MEGKIELLEARRLRLRLKSLKIQELRKAKNYAKTRKICENVLNYANWRKLPKKNKKYKDVEARAA